MLQGLKSEAMIQHERPPYCYEFYNVSAWYQTPLSTTPVIARISNSLIETLNENTYLPKYVIVIPDKDVIESQSKRDFGAKNAIEEHLSWLVKQVSKSLLTRHEDLKNRNPGTVTAELTRVIWVKMLTRPITEDTVLKKVWKLRPKFNSALDAIMSGICMF